ncbi:universal stress protein [Streptomyces sp. L7]
MTRPITAGVDGSAESLAALAWAGREAVRRGLALRVVHVWRYEDHHALDTGDRDTQDRWVRDAAAEAARALAERHPGLDVTTDVLEGDPVDTLTAAAAESELLVLGSARARAGRRLSARFRRAAGDSRCRTARRAGARRGRGVRGSRRARDRRGAAGKTPRTVPPRSASRSRRRRHAWRHRAGRAGVDPAARVRLQPGLHEAPRRGRRPGAVREEGPRRGPGAVAGALPRRARRRAHRDGQRGAGAAVGGRTGAVDGRGRALSIGGARIGSVAHGVLHHAECPVAVVPSQEAS